MKLIFRQFVSLFLAAVFCLPVVAQNPRTGSQQDKPLDSKRTGFAPTAVRFQNLAAQDVTTWSALTGNATVSTGTTAPDGTTGAATLSIISPPEGYRRVYGSTRTVAVGDWVIAGVWAKGVTLSNVDGSTGTLENYSVATLKVFDATEGYRIDSEATNARAIAPIDALSDTEWRWLTTAFQVTTAVAGNQAELRFDLNCDNQHSIAFYVPVLHHIPSGVITDAEAEGLLQNLYPVPNGATAGTVTTLSSQTFQAPLKDAGGQVYNVKAFGAIGSGLVDESTAFALTLSRASAGETIFLPAGNYRLEQPLIVNKRINIKGEGAASAITCNVGTGADCIVIDGSTGAGTYTDNVTYRDFAVLGGASACRNAVIFRNVTHADVSNVHVAAGTASTGYGVTLEGCLISTWQFTVNAAMNYPYTATAPSNGILVKGSALNPSNANLFLYPAVVISNASGESFFIDGSSGITGTTNNWIIGGNIEGGALNGLHLKQANYWNIQSIHLENTSGFGDYNRVRTIIENCSHGYIGAGVGLTGLWLINTTDTTIDGVVADYVNLDFNTKRTRVGRIQYNVTGLGAFVDAGEDTSYTGDLQVPGVVSSFLSGKGATGSQVNLVRNGGAEFWNGSSCIDWSTESSALTKTGTGQADTRKLFGDYAVKTTSGTQYVFVNAPQPDVGLMAGQVITASAWIYIPSGQVTQPSLNLQLWLDGGAGVLSGQSTAATDAWTQITTTFRVPSGTTQVQVTVQNTASGAGGYFYMDGVSAVMGKTGAHAEATRLPHALGLTLNNGTYKTGIRPSSSQAAEINYTLPADDGTSGQAMLTDGSGGLSWGSVATLSGATNYYPFFNTSSTLSTSGSLLQNFSGNLIVGSHVLFTDNTHDIGVASDNRPRNVYVATSLTSPRVYLGGGSASLTSGSGNPEGSITAEPGSIYLRTNGTWYLKTSGSGSTGWTLQGSSGANTALSNLASVAINTTLVSDTNNTDDLGTSSIAWRDLYLAGTFNLLGRSDPGSPTNNDLWRSTTRQQVSIRNSGQTENLTASMWKSSAQVFFDTTTTETSLIADTGVGTKTLAASRLVAGSQVRIKASGLYGTKATSPGTFTIKLKNGATTMLTIAAFTLPTNVADQNWWIEATGALNATGSSGTINWTINFYYNDGAGDMKTRTYTVNSTTINTTTTNALDITGQFSVSDVANFWQTDVAIIEIL